MIELVNVQKIFRDGTEKNHILHNINLKISEGDFITIMGPSGCGKSTLLNILSLLTQPTEGEVYLNGSPVKYNKEKEIEKLRRNHIGLVFQNANLIRCLNPLDNLLLALNSKERYSERKKKALNYLDMVGLADKYNANIQSLSGGEVQRVSIVRALINKPQLLLCDEPTGALDADNSLNVMNLIKNLYEETKCSLVIVTHDETIGKLGRRKINLMGGIVNEVETNI